MKRALWLAVALALGGCVTRPPTVGAPAPAAKDEREEQAWRELVARYSARAELFKGFDTILFAGTTLQTPAFREARVRRLAAFQALAQERVQQLLAREVEEASRTHELFLGIHAGESRFDDFDKPSSLWSVALVTPEGEVRPTRVKRVGRVNMDMRSLYPYLGDFWVAYRLEFPTTLADGKPVIPEGTEKVVLRLASTLGQVELPVATR